MIRTTALALGLLALAAPASALTIVQTCEEVDGSLSEAFGTLPGAEGYITFARTTAETPDWTDILQHCPTGQSLIVDSYGPGEAQDDFWEAVYGDEAYTLRDLRGLLVEGGGAGRLYTATVPSCACADMGLN